MFFQQYIGCAETAMTGLCGMPRDDEFQFGEPVIYVAFFIAGTGLLFSPLPC